MKEKGCQKLIMIEEIQKVVINDKIYRIIIKRVKQNLGKCILNILLLIKDYIFI
jgi:hypothetical protein